ncbi:MAG: hypothetical protein IJ048_14560 [Clostridia bacterium]|nr:hypothetical protein [Clostridia bacterium]
MKKFFRAIALIALIALFCSCAFAESGSFDELLAQRQAIDCALIGTDGYTTLDIAQGIFTIGTDLPAGAYRVETAVLTAVSVYAADPSEEAIFEYTVSQKEPLEELKLEEGNVLVMTGSVTTFTVISIDAEPSETPVSELLAQREALDNQLAGSADFTTLKTSQATLTVGIDIPAGTYRTGSSPMSQVAVYNGDPHDDNNLVQLYIVTGKEPVEKFVLDEGLILVVSGMMDIEISTYTGLSF